jgi:hypothetical protein
MLRTFGIVSKTRSAFGRRELGSGLLLICRGLQAAVPFRFLPRLLFSRDLSRPILHGYHCFGHFLSEKITIDLIRERVAQIIPDKPMIGIIRVDPPEFKCSVRFEWIQSIDCLLQAYRILHSRSEQ